MKYNAVEPLPHKMIYFVNVPSISLYSLVFDILGLHKLYRDVDVHLKDEWLVERDTHNVSNILSNFFGSLEETQKKVTYQNRLHSSNG